MAATFAGRLISLLSLAVLARLLSPDDFGLLAFALVFLGYLESVGDLGTGAALVYWPQRWREVAQLTFLANLLMGLVWMGVTLAAAPAVAGFFGRPESEQILQVLALVIPLKALGTTHDALLQRELRFRTRMVPEVGLIATKAVVALALALMGFGVWSLVWGQVAGQALCTLLLWILEPWRPGLFLPRGLIRPVVEYGRGIVGVNVLAAVIHHVDIVIVGRMFSTAVLGLYQMAYRVPDMAVTLLVRITSKVLFPALSRLRGSGGQLRNFYLPALRYLSLLTVPTTLGLAALAEPMVLTLFGEQWAGSVPILRVIALYAGIRALGTYAGDLMKATGRPGLLALLGTARAVVLVPVLVVAGTHSALAVAIALTAETILSTALYLGVAGHFLRVGWGETFEALKPSLLGSVPLLAFLLLWILVARDLPDAVELLGGCVLGAGLYLFSVRAVAPDTFRKVVEALGSAFSHQTPRRASTPAQGRSPDPTPASTFPATGRLVLPSGGAPSVPFQDPSHPVSRS